MLLIPSPCLFCAMPTIDVAIRSEPKQNPARCVEHRIGTYEKPTVLSVEAPLSRHEFEWFTRCEPTPPAFEYGVSIMWMHQVYPLAVKRVSCG
jgi:hypothetical protein